MNKPKTIRRQNAVSLSVPITVLPSRLQREISLWLCLQASLLQHETETSKTWASRTEATYQKMRQRRRSSLMSAPRSFSTSDKEE